MSRLERFHCIQVLISSSLIVGTHPDYLAQVREIEEMREKRLFVAEVFKQYELQASDGEFEREQLLATQEFEGKRLELKDCLLHDLQEKRKAYETYRHSMELCSGGECEGGALVVALYREACVLV